MRRPPPPPQFIPAWDDWGKTYSAQQFPILDYIPQLLRLKLMCLASMVHHRWFIVERFNANYVVLASGQLFRDEAVLHQLDNNPGCVVVTYPWSLNEGSSTGVPPHVAVLQELQCLKVKQQSLIDSFVSKVKTAIEECDLSGGSLMEQRLRQIFDGFSADIREQLRHVGEGAENTEDVDAQRIETGQGYRWHYFDGQFHRVLKDWHFPRIGVLDAWKQWWIGDSVWGIPPLRMLDSKDLEFLDAIPLSEEERHGRTGPNKNRRRPARKTLCDLKFLMMYITDKVVAAGRFADVITMASVVDMFSMVATEFGGARNSQKKWHTISQEIRRST